MPGRDLLDRFRPAASPGTVARVGVPSDAVEDADLHRVLDSVRPAVEAADQIRSQAREAARAIVAEADARCAELLAQARIDAHEARAQAQAAVIELGHRREQALLDQAGQQAELVRAEGRHRLPEAVARVVARVLAEVSPATMAVTAPDPDADDVAEVRAGTAAEVAPPPSGRGGEEQ